MSQNPLDHVGLRRFDKSHDLHRAAALRTRQWVYFINPLDQQEIFGAHALPACWLYSACLFTMTASCMSYW